MGLALKLGSVAPDFERRMLVLWMGEFVSTVACVTDSYIGFVGTAVEHYSESVYLCFTGLAGATEALLSFALC